MHMLFDSVEKLRKGEVHFTARNGFPDLFLNMCKKEGAVLRDISNCAEELRASAPYKEYPIVVRAAKKAGMDLKKDSVAGVGPLIRKYKARIGIPLGILCFFVIYLVLSSMLWSVDISGLETIREEDFRQFLDGIDARKGVFVSSVDCNEIERLAEGFNASVLQVTANLVGCKLFIHVKEREKPPAIKEENKYCNIIAAKDGEVLKADIFAGESHIQVGDAVKKGDLLAAGAIPLKTGETRLLEAEASVIARTHSVISCNTPLVIKVNQLKRTKDRYSVCFFGLVFPDRKNDFVSQTAYLRTAAGVIPIGRIRSRQNEFTETQLTLSMKEAMLIAASDLAVTVLDAYENTDIVLCSVTVSANNGAQLDCELFLNEEIAKKEYFELLN